MKTPFLVGMRELGLGGGTDSIRLAAFMHVRVRAGDPHEGVGKNRILPTTTVRIAGENLRRR